MQEHIEKIKEFVERFESNEADASDFVDNANWIITVFKEVITRDEYEQTFI